MFIEITTIRTNKEREKFVSPVLININQIVDVLSDVYEPSKCRITTTETEGNVEGTSNISWLAEQSYEEIKAALMQASGQVVR